MTDAAFHRIARPHVSPRVTVPLRSDDTPLVRAANIAALLGWTGDDAAIRGQIAVIADALEQYAAADREGRGG